MRRKPRPPAPDRREPWQIEQAARCGCKGTDDMCPCQNEHPWPRPRRDLEGEIRTLQLQQETDRQSIAIYAAALEAHKARADKLEGALRGPIDDVIAELQCAVRGLKFKPHKALEHALKARAALSADGEGGNG